MILSVRAALAGISVGAITWWLFAPGGLGSANLAGLQRPPERAETLDRAALLLARWSGADRFGLFPAPDAADADALAVRAASLRLQGTSLSTSRKAALISVGGAKGQWLAMDEPSAGLELIELQVGRAIVRTSSGDTVTLEVFEPARRAADERSNDAGP